MISTRPLRLALLLLCTTGVVAPPLVAQTAAPTAHPPAADPAALPPTPEAAAAWGLAGSDVRPDPAVRFGILPNGMKYAIRRNTTPAGTVAIRLHVRVGSVAEADDERGLAHFLEHMAFNGSTHIPEGTLVPLLERSGLAFGPDTNASTGFDQTIYQLDLPNASDDLVATGLKIIRETAGELLIAPDAVDRERGVIESERRLRDTVQLRNLIEQLGFSLPDSPVSRRLPIGTTEVITTSPAARLHAFYDRYYRPERSTLVIVGDFDVARMEAMVVARFGDWHGRGTAGAELDFGRITPGRAAAADNFVHPEIPEIVNVSLLRPADNRRDSVAVRRDKLAEGLAQRIINRRLAALALAPQAPFSQAQFNVTTTFNTFQEAGLIAVAPDGHWQTALTAGENELRRALTHGFTPAELTEQLSATRAELVNAAQGATTQRSQTIAGAIIQSLNERQIFATPADGLARFDAAAPTMTPDAVLAALRQRLVGSGEPLVRVASKQPVAGGPAAIQAAFSAARQVAVTAPTAHAAAVFAYTDFGPAGRIVHDDRIDDLGVRRIRFANNVILNIKKTDFEQGRVRMQVRVDGGTLLNTREDPTRVGLASLMFLGGLDAHSFDDLRTILAGRTVSSQFTAATDSFGGQVTTTPADLRTQAQLFAAYIVHPGYRPEGLSLLHRVLPQQYALSDATPEAVMTRDQEGILAGDDPRFQFPPLDRMLALDWAGLRPAIADSLGHGAIEIGIVGDVDEAAAIEAVASTFGALSERRAAFDPHTDARRVSFAANHATRTLIHKGDANQALVQVNWSARDDSDVGATAGLQLLASVIQLMLTDELRERLGNTYSPSASADLSSDYPGYGHIEASSNVSFAHIAPTEAAIDAIAAKLRDQPIPADLLERARQPLLAQLTRARRENGYWLDYVARATTQPDRIDRSRRAIALVQAVSAADIQHLAQTYLTPERELRIRAISDKAVTPAVPAR